MTSTPSATPQANGHPRRKRPPRPRISWDRFKQDHRRANPELYDPYEVAAIRDDMLSKHGLPRSVVEDLLDFRIRMDRRDLDPNYQPRRGSSRTPEALLARAAESVRFERLMTQRQMGKIDAEFLMTDGRRLGDWRLEELRKLNGAFAFILKAAGAGDDKRTVDQVMTPKLWKSVKAE